MGKPWYKRPDLYGDKHPEWVVQQAGRYTWRVWVQHGVFSVGPEGAWWTRWSEKSAVAKGKRELARYVREFERKQNYRVVRGN